MCFVRCTGCACASRYGVRAGGRLPPREAIKAGCVRFAQADAFQVQAGRHSWRRHQAPEEAAQVRRRLQRHGLRWALLEIWASPGADVGMFETEQLSHARASFCHDTPHVHCTTWSGTRGQNNVGCARSHAIPCDTVWYAAWHGLVTYRHVACRIPMRTTALRVARCTLRVARCRFKLVSSAEMRAKEVRTGSACSTYAHYPSRAHRATAHCAYPPGPTAFPHCIALAPIARDAAAAYGSAVRVCCIMVVAPTAAMQRVRRRAADTVRRGGRCSTRRR